MKISENGIAVIKKFEGYRSNAYKALPSEHYYTIGYGHYGADVDKNSHISEEEAECLLRDDLCSCEAAVNKIGIAEGLQPAFDALVSFTYNCGESNLKKLCDGRTLETVAEKICLYNHAGGVVVNGLTTRRKAESEMIKAAIAESKNQLNAEYGVASMCYPAVSVKFTSIVDALKSINVDSSFDHRKRIAEKNGITGYKGSYDQNLEMLRLLKKGILLICS